MAFELLSNSTEVLEVLKRYPEKKSIVFCKTCQGGKTSDVLKIIEGYYKTSSVVFISDKNCSLASQTNTRARTLGFEVVNYRDKSSGIKIGKFLRESIGKKRILHMLMEVNNLDLLETFILVNEEIPITLVIDEGDLSKNTILASKKEKDSEDDEEDGENVASSENMPPISKLLLKCKNILKTRENSRTILVTATPQGILMSEKDDWLVLYKQPYLNYVGIGLDHPFNGYVSNITIEDNACKTRDRWTGNSEDTNYNTYYRPVSYGVEQFLKAETKDSSIKQIMLISLENRKLQQHLLGEFVKNNLITDESCDVIIFNSDTKTDSEETLAMLFKNSSKNKIIVIAGFMAARGISFTDFSDKENMFELIIQINNTKKYTPINSATQSLRVFGPARRTVSKPCLITNRYGKEDIQSNIIETYRLIKDISDERFPIKMGNFNNQRPLCQSYCMRYLKQGNVREDFIYKSLNQEEHLPII